MNARLFFDLVARMREAQRTFLATGDPGACRLKTELESEADREIARVKAVLERRAGGTQTPQQTPPPSEARAATPITGAELCERFCHREGCDRAINEHIECGKAYSAARLTGRPMADTDQQKPAPAVRTGGETL